MSPGDAARLVALAAIWGASYLFIRIAAPSLGPFPLVAGRVLLAGVVLLALAAAARRLPALRQRWRGYLLLGAINAAAPFTLISAAELHVTASLASILVSTSPLFSALAAAAWLGDPLTMRRLGGIVLGIVGVAVLVGWSPLPMTPEVLGGIAMLLVASLCYGVGAVYSRARFSGSPPLALAAGQQVAATLLLVVPAAATLPAADAVTAPAIGALIALALFSTAVAYLLYFGLIERIGPTRTLTVTFLVPAFGVVWGAALLREPVTAGMLVGLALTLASVAFVANVRVRLPTLSWRATR